MEIICGKTAGFCYGINRAVNMAKEELTKRDKIYCFGELAHNPYVVEELTNMGMVTIHYLSEVEKGSTVMFRAHGVPPSAYEEASKRGLKVIDLTCPKVLKVHDIARKYKEEGAYIIITGEKGHPEILGTEGCAGKNSIVILELEEAENLDLSDKENVVLISQTTFSVEKFAKIEEILKKKKNDIKIIKTICAATHERQAETKQIAENVDLMVIIGGAKSSNTNKLYNISKEHCKEVIFAHDEKDIDRKFICKFNKIGVMAGASAPQELIQRVIEKIKGDKD